MTRFRNLVVLIAFLFSVFALSCRKADDSVIGSNGLPQKQVNVAAASNLRWVFEELEIAFEQQHPDIDLHVTYGSSGHFYSQIRQGAPFDIFLSADESYPQQLVIDQVADKETLYCYAFGKLVAWKRNGIKIDLDKDGLKALQSNQVKRIAVANPRLAPYGKAAEEALVFYELDSIPEDRFVYGNNISQTAQFANSGAADVGLIALSIALAEPMQKAGSYWIVPAESYSPIRQCLVVIEKSDRRNECQHLADFIQSDQAEAILERNGFDTSGNKP